VRRATALVRPAPRSPSADAKWPVPIAYNVVAFNYRLIERGYTVRCHVGDYAIAIDHANRAMRLSPLDLYSFLFRLARGVGHLFQRQLPDAWSLMGLWRRPSEVASEYRV
jgi:hypothetical protein